MQNKDTEYLGKLRDYYASKRVLPSFTIVGKLLGLSSSSSVAAFVGRMKESRHLESGDSGRIQPGKAFFDRPMLDMKVPAGTPSPLMAESAEMVSIDQMLIASPSSTVLVPVKGDSMIEAGLMDGDTVVVRCQAPHKTGDIVVALIDGEHTVKYLAHDKKGFYLKPGNKNYKDIRPKNDLTVAGLVVGSFRKY